MIMNGVLIYGLLMASLLILGCSDPDSPEVEYELAPTRQPTERIRYRVEGGGNIDFAIADASDSLAVLVSRYQFETISELISVSKVDADSADVRLLESLFQGSINIGGTMYRNEAPTGTWTYLYIEHGDDWLRVANAAIIGESHSFAELVRDRLDDGS
jgi:hypothetical protein